MQTIYQDKHSLAGHLLVATHAVRDGFFDRTVILLCVHNAQGAIGLIINQPADVDFRDVMAQLKIKMQLTARSLPVYAGGPVEPQRGFIIHSAEYHAEFPLFQNETIEVSANAALLKDVANGGGPRQALLTLGYAGWSPGQLEAEMQAGSWITVPATRELIFHTDDDLKWNMAALSLGVDMMKVSPFVGHA